MNFVNELGKLRVPNDGKRSGALNMNWHNAVGLVQTLKIDLL
jgi:hypothetical protein